MSIELKHEHLMYCFDSLVEYLDTSNLLKMPKELPDYSAPLFVTWKKGETEDLRGCIGTFSHEKLSKNLGKYAVVSAVQDVRFSPVDKTELPSLSVAVSILFNFENGKKWNEWEVGRHGIEIDFEIEDKAYRGTFLPEVAEEQGWNHEVTLKYLIKKAGYYGNHKSVLPHVKITTYESKKLKMSYKEYEDLKNKAEKNK